MHDLGDEDLGNMTWVWQAKHVPELLPVLRVGNPRLRLLKLVCPKNHLILTVYHTTIGPVAAYHRTTFAETDVSRNGVKSVRWHHARTDLAVVLEEEDAGSAFMAECKCGPQVVPLVQLTAALAASRRRVVLDLTSHRL